MDIKKVEEIIEKSQLTDEAKDLIYKLLPDADKPEIKEEILRTIDFEIEMNDAVAEESEEIIDIINDGDKMMDAADSVAAEQMDELVERTNEKMAELDTEKEEIEKETDEPSSDEGPVEEVAKEEVSAPEAPVEAVPQWNQPVEPVTPSVAPAAEAPAVAPWNQTVTETTTSTTQPAPFPGAPVGQV